jgi:hypothetical protein
LFAIALLPWSPGARAGLFSDSMTYDIRVVDENSRPIPFASVWVISDTVDRSDLRPADLARLVRRYADDVDFIFINSIYDIWVLRTGQDGTVRYELEDTEVHGLRRIRASFAGLKRGFRPAQFDDDARNNSHRSITLRMQSSPADKFEPRLEEMYRIRAMGMALPDNSTRDDRRRLLQECDARLRALAADLEKDSHPDDAAAVYYNLAYLPSVDVVRDESGAETVVGFTNSFDEHDPRRVADRRRAWQLSRDHPMMEYDAMFDSYDARGLMYTGKEENAALRQAYIADTENMIARYGERLWPWAYALLWRMHNANGEYEAGCRALRQFHDFDPGMYKDWGYLERMYAADIWVRHGPAGAACKL